MFVKVAASHVCELFRTSCSCPLQKANEWTGAHHPATNTQTNLTTCVDDECHKLTFTRTNVAFPELRSSQFTTSNTIIGGHP